MTPAQQLAERCARDHGGAKSGPRRDQLVMLQRRLQLAHGDDVDTLAAALELLLSLCPACLDEAIVLLEAFTAQARELLGGGASSSAQARICRGCQRDRGAPTPLTFEQLRRLFAVCLVNRGDDPAKLAAIVVELTGLCPECVDQTLTQAEEYDALASAVMTGQIDEGEAARIVEARSRRGDTSKD